MTRHKDLHEKFLTKTLPRHTPLSHDGTERDTDFLYNPFQDTSSRSSDKPSLTSQLSQTSRLTSPPPQTSRRTALSLPLVYTFLALPHILIAVLEFSQTVQGTQYVFSSFPPNLGQIKMYGVLFYSVGVAARAWVNPVVFLIGEWRRVFSKCYRQRWEEESRVAGCLVDNVGIRCRFGCSQFINENNWRTWLVNNDFRKFYLRVKTPKVLG